MTGQAYKFQSTAKEGIPYLIYCVATDMRSNRTAHPWLSHPCKLLLWQNIQGDSDVILFHIYASRFSLPYNNNNDRLTAFDPGQPG